MARGAHAAPRHWQCGFTLHARSYSTTSMGVNTMCNLPKGNQPKRPSTMHHDGVPSVGVHPPVRTQVTGDQADYTTADFDPNMKAVQSPFGP